MRRIYKALSVLLAILTILSIGTSAFAAADELPGTIAPGPSQSAASSRTPEPSPGEESEEAEGTQAPGAPQTSAEPTAAQTPEAAAEPTPTEPAPADIPIATLADIQKIGVDPAYPLDGSYLLSGDIDGTQADGTKTVIAPIGSADAPFTGTFYGGGHTISNIQIKNEDVFAPYVGLFSRFDGKAEDVSFLNIEVTGNTAGIFAGALGANAQISGLFMMGSIVRPGFPEDTDKEKIPAFIAGGLAGAAEAGDAVKIENTAAFVNTDERKDEEAGTDAEPNKQIGAFIGSNGIAAERFENNLWSSAYGQDSAFGVDSPVNGSDGVFKIEPSPSYLAVMAGQGGVLSADMQTGEPFGLTFREWNADETMASLSSKTDKDITVTAGETVGATSVVAVYERAWADGRKTEVQFSIPVIISQMIDEEKELEPVDPVFPTQIEQVVPLEPVDDVFPTILSETVPLVETGPVNEISTWEQFQNIGNTEYNTAYTMDADYVLSADIIAEDGDFTPIGTAENPFSGTFDGRDHTIDLNNNTGIDRNQIYYGLFGEVTEWRTGGTAEDGSELPNDAMLHSGFSPEESGALPYGRIKNLYLKSALEITMNPCDQAVVPGQKAEFNVAASDLPGAAYQWQVSTDGGSTWEDIVGATEPEYTFETAGDESQNGYQYRCRVSAGEAPAASLFDLFAPTKALAAESADTVYSEAATLTVDASLYAAANAGTNPNFYMDGWTGTATNESNRAMVWFGSFDQYSDSNPEPVLNRVLYSDNNKIMLMSEYMLKNVGYDMESIHYYRSDGTSSNLRAWMVGGASTWDGAAVDYSSTGYLPSAFNSTERSWILPTTLEAEKASLESGGKTGKSTSDQIYTLTLAELQNTRYFPNGAASRTTIGTTNSAPSDSYLHSSYRDSWYTRTPADHEFMYRSGYNGQLEVPVIMWNDIGVGARPVMNLDATKVTFVAASNTGGAPSVDGTLAKSSGASRDKNSQWMYAYAGNAQSYRVFARGGESINIQSLEQADGSNAKVYTVHYTGASYSGNNYLGAMLVNTDTHEKWAGRVAKITSASGSATITLPTALQGSNLELYLWNESETNHRTSAAVAKTSADVTWRGPEISNISFNGGWTTSKTLTFTVKDYTGSGISNVFWSYESGQATGNRLSSSTGSYRIDNITSQQTSVTMYLVAYDKAGRRTERQVVMQNFDRIAPTVSNVYFTSDATDGGLTAYATVTDGQSGVNRVFISKNSAATSGITLYNRGGNSWSSNKFFDNGNFYVIAYDNVGNRTVSSAISGVSDLPVITNQRQSPSGWATEKQILANVTDYSGTGISKVFYSKTSGASSGTAMTHQGGGVYASGTIIQTGTYYIVAYNGKGKRKEVSVNVTSIDRESPKISDYYYNEDDMAVYATLDDGAGSGISRAFISTNANATSGINMSRASGNIWKTAAFTTTGDYYVIAYDGVEHRSVSASTVRVPSFPLILNAQQNTTAPAIQKTISATVRNQGGGSISRVFYSTKSGATEPESNAFLMTNKGGDVYESGYITNNGTYYIVAYNSDGRRSEASVKVTNIDKEGPVISNISQDPPGWSKSNKTISATVIDYGMGLDKDRVYLTTDPAATTGTKMTASGSIFKTEPLGLGTYYIVAYDIVNNRGVSSAIVVEKIDNTPPVVTSTSQNPTGAAAQKTLTATVTDNSNSITSVFYSSVASGATSGTPMTLQTGSTYTSSIPIKADGRYYIYAIDEAGNITPSGTPVDVTGLLKAIGEGDPMYWMGQGSGNDTNRAMVWFGEYWQTAGSNAKSPVLWRTIRSDGQGTYGDVVTLTSEYVLHHTFLSFDSYRSAQYHIIKNIHGGGYENTSSATRYWMNSGPGDGALDTTVTSKCSVDWDYPMYTNAFSSTQQGLLVASPIVITTPDNADGSGANYTLYDKVFPLSIQDLQNSAYFTNDDSRKAIGTPMATNNYMEGSYSDKHGSSTGEALVSYYRYVDYLTYYRHEGKLVQRGTSSIASGSLSGAIPTAHWMIDPELGEIRSQGGARPSVNLIPGKVMFVASSSSGGAPGVSTSLSAAGGTAPTTWSTTPDVGGATFRAFTRDAGFSANMAVTNNNNGTVKVTYNSLKGGDDNYIGMMIVNTSTKKKYVGRVQKITGANGSVTVSLPSGVSSSLSGYKVFSWIEDETSQTVGTITNSLGSAVDVTAPTVSNVTQVPTTWSNAKSISATVTDSGSGVAKVVCVNEETLTELEMKLTSSNTYTISGVTEGEYHVYAVDKVNNVSQNFSVTVDKIDVDPPEIISAAQDMTVQGAELVFKVEVKDALSGVKRVFWSNSETGATSGTNLKDTGETTADGNKIFTSAGNMIGSARTCYVYAEDNAGNITKSSSVSVEDITPPEIKDGVVTPDGWAKEKTLTVTVTDLTSDVDTVFWSTQESGALTGVPMRKTGTSSVYETYSPVGENTYYIYAVDSAGNTTPDGYKLEVTQIDNDAPEITNAKQDELQSTYGSAVVTANVVDKGIGIDKVYIVKDVLSGATEDDAGAVEMEIAGEGLYQAPDVTETGEYYIYAVDMLGNRTENGTWVHVVVQDIPAPEVFNARQEPTGWAQSKTIKAQVTDAASAISKVFYTTVANDAKEGTNMYLNKTADEFGNPPPENEYISPAITTPGTYYVYAENARGYRNRKGIEVVIDMVDREGPAITNCTVTPGEWASGKGIEAAVEDTRSGIDTVFVSASKTAEAPEESAYVMEADADSGIYKTAGKITREGTYYVIAYDKVGNRTVSEAVAVSRIDDIGPEITNYMQSRSPRLTAVAEISDAGSGLSHAFISKDQNATEAAEAQYVMAPSGSGDVYETGDGIVPTADGEYYYVIAYDNAGNRSVSGYFVVTEAWATGEPTIVAGSTPDGWAREKTVYAQITADTSVNAGNTIVQVYLTLVADHDDTGPQAGDIILTKNADGLWVSGAVTENTPYTIVAKDSLGVFGHAVVPVIQIDRVAPVFGGTPYVNEEGTTAFKTVTVDIQDGETGSGVARAFLTTDPNATQAASEEFNMTRAVNTQDWTSGEIRTEGIYVAVSYDNAGNRSVSEAVQVVGIDTVPPEITVPPMLKKGSAEKTMVLYTDIKDPGTGVARAFISTDYAATEPVVDKAAGLYAYEMTKGLLTDTWSTGDIAQADYMGYYIIAYDNAGNRTITDAKYVIKETDTDPPVVDASQSPEGYAASKKIVAEVTDGMSGVKRVWYSSEWMDAPYSADTEMTLNAGTGLYETESIFEENKTWYVYAEDNDGNITSAGTAVTIDKIAKGNIIIESVTAIPTGWTNQSVQVTATISVPDGVAVTGVYFSESETASSGTSMSYVTGQKVTATATISAAQDKTYYVNATGSDGRPALERVPFTVQIDKTVPTVADIAQEPVLWSWTKKVTATVKDTGGSNLKAVFATQDKNAVLNADGSLPTGAVTMTKNLLTDTYKSADIRTYDAAWWVVAVDAAGNRAVSTNSVELKIDDVSPTAALAHDPATAADNYNNGTDYTLKLTEIADDKSGADTVWYNTENVIETATQATYTAGASKCDIPVSVTEDEDTTYYVWVKDTVGNASEAYTTTIYRDTAVPELTGLTHDPLSAADSYTNSADVTLQASGITDALSGAAEVWYGTEGDVTKATKADGYTAGDETCDITVTPVDGKTTYYVWVKDQAGNVSDPLSTDVYKDTLGPTLGKPAADETEWTNQETFTFTVGDIKEDTSKAGEFVSGVARVLYSNAAITPENMADAQEMTLSETDVSGVYTATVDETPEAQGELTYYFRAVDSAGNLGPEKTVVIRSDRTAPEGKITVKSNEWTSMPTPPYKNYYYNKTESVSLEYTEDDMSEISDFRYRISETPLTEDELKALTTGWKFPMNAKLVADVANYVYIRINDAAGNVRYIGTDTLLVDATKPDVGAAADMTVAPAWANAACTEVTVTAANVKDIDTGGFTSGIAGVYLMKENRPDVYADVMLDDMAYELTEDGSGSYTATFAPPDATTKYYLRAVDNAGNWNDYTKSVEVTVLVDKEGPAFTDMKQETENWAASKLLSATASEEDKWVEGTRFISSGIKTLLWSDDKDATAENGTDVFTAPEGETLKTYAYAPATPVREDIGADGKAFYFIGYDAAGNRSAQEMLVTKVDASAPTVQKPVFDKDTMTVSAAVEDTLSGMGGTDEQDGPFREYAGVYYSESADALPETITDAAALDGYVKIEESAETPGTFVTGELAEKTYYVFAVDNVGNAAAKQRVDADVTPPLIDNVSFTDLGAGKWRIAFTVTDAVSGVEDSAILWSGSKTDFPNTAEKDPDVENGYYFEVTADINNVPHYVQATDRSGNIAVREMYDEKNVINVSVPMKLMFASFPNVMGADFTAPTYTVTNNSNIVKTRLSVSNFEAEPDNTFTLVPPGTPLTSSTLTLYMQGVENEKATAFNAMGKFNLMPGADFGDVKRMGTLAVKPATGDDPASRGMFTYAGDVFGYAPGNVPTLRGEFTTTLRFENVRFGE